MADDFIDIPLPEFYQLQNFVAPLKGGSYIQNWP
jgi:hypothetical protein